jgi:hypothetical protein
MGNPLINELVIGTGFKDRFSTDSPLNDAQFANFFLRPLLADIFASLGIPVPTGDRTDLLPLVTYTGPIVPPGTPAGPVADLLRINTGIPPPGRQPEAWPCSRWRRRSKETRPASQRPPPVTTSRLSRPRQGGTRQPGDVRHAHRRVVNIDDRPCRDARSNPAQTAATRRDPASRLHGHLPHLVGANTHPRGGAAPHQREETVMMNDLRPSERRAGGPRSRPAPAPMPELSPAQRGTSAAGHRRHAEEPRRYNDLRWPRPPRAETDPASTRAPTGHRSIWRWRPTTRRAAARLVLLNSTTSRRRARRAHVNERP